MEPETVSLSTKSLCSFTDNIGTEDMDKTQVYFNSILLRPRRVERQVSPIPHQREELGSLFFTTPERVKSGGEAHSLWISKLVERRAASATFG